MSKQVTALKKLLIFCILSISNLTGYSQLYPRTSFRIGEFRHPIHKPRTKKDSDKIGFYQIAVSLDKFILNPGDSFIAKVFFTGYGNIGASKVAVYSSKSEIFDSTSSLLHSWGKLPEQYIWGAGKLSFGKESYIIGMSGGLEFRDTTVSTIYVNGQPKLSWKDTVFWDNYVDLAEEPEDITILTELEIVNAPLTFNLKLNKDVEPGDYKINFHYTYFNGEQWIGSTETLEFKINNPVEQHSVWLEYLAAFVGVVSILPLFAKGLSFLWNFLLKILSKWKKNNKPSVEVTSESKSVPTKTHNSKR